MSFCHYLSYATKALEKQQATGTKHPQKVQIFSNKSRLDLSVTFPVLLLGDSHCTSRCAVVESDAVVLTTFDLEQQQPMFQVTSIYLTEIWEGLENPCFQLAICAY